MLPDCGRDPTLRLKTAPVGDDSPVRRCTAAEMPFAARGNSDYHSAIVHFFPGETLNMGPESFRTNASFVPRLVFAVAFSILFATAAHAQAKPERQSKAVKPAQTTQTAQPAQPAAATESDSEAAESSKPEEKAFKGMKYRLIGPFRGGRSLTAAGIPGDPTTYYFGATGGGVWKSTDGAMTWSPVFDKEGTSAIGSIAVASSNHNVLYVGTGEACIRGNISHGDGVYRTLDGGKTWKNVGLRDSRAIGKVVINPMNPDIVFVAALGHPYGPNTERGIFRTTDGGKTWEKVLYKDENTGGIDIAFDPHNPNILFAALWQARRTSWSMSSGGPGERPLSLERWRDDLEATGGAWPTKGALRKNRRRGGLEFGSRLRADRGPQSGWRAVPVR